MRRNLKLIAVATVCSAGAVAAGAGVLPSRADTPQSSRERLESAYPALRAEAAARDQLPPVTRGELESGPEAVFRPDVARARLVLARDATRMYLVPAPEHACVAVVDDGGTRRQIACAGTEAIVTQPLVGATVGRDGYVVQGIAPAGTRDYRLATATGELLAIDVTGGAFMQEVDDEPLTLAYVDAAGTERAILLKSPPAPPEP